VAQSKRSVTDLARGGMQKLAILCAETGSVNDRVLLPKFITHTSASDERLLLYRQQSCQHPNPNGGITFG
jgi:hypothetical protein